MIKTSIISKKGFCVILLIIALSEKSTAMNFFQTPMSPSGKTARAGTNSPGNCQISIAETLRSEGEETVSAENLKILGVQIKGNVDLDNSLILRIFDQRDGTLFSEERARRGLEKLENLPAIKSADLRKIYNSKRNGIYLILTLQKAGTFSVYPAATRTFANKLSIGLKVSESNFRQRNENFDFSVLFRGATILSASWDKPYLADMPVLGFHCNIKYKDYQYPYPEFEEAFLNNSVKRLESVVSLHFHIYSAFSILISPGIDRIFGEGPVLRKNIEKSIFAESHEGLFSTLEISMRAGRLNNTVYPTSGFKLNLSRKDWGLFNKNPSITTKQYYFRSSFFFRIKKPIFLIHTQSVISNSGLPLILLEHLGGETSIRGYEYGVFRGDNSFLTRCEIRLPLNFTDISDAGDTLLPLDFNLFLDTGMCWNKDIPISKELLHSGFGCSMNIISPDRGILRIGCMWNRKTTGKFYLDIGRKF